MCGLNASGTDGPEPASAALIYERVTVAELAIRYELECAALDVELEIERARLAREGRPARFGPARGAL